MAILLILPISVLMNDFYSFLPIRLHVLLTVYLHQFDPSAVDLIVLQLFFFEFIDLVSISLRHFFDLLVPFLLRLKEICMFGADTYHQFFFEIARKMTIELFYLPLLLKRSLYLNRKGITSSRCIVFSILISCSSRCKLILLSISFSLRYFYIINTVILFDNSRYFLRDSCRFWRNLC